MATIHDNVLRPAMRSTLPVMRIYHAVLVKYNNARLRSLSHRHINGLEKCRELIVASAWRGILGAQSLVG